MTAPRAVLDPIVVRRQNELVDLYHGWSGDGDPDDDPDFVDAAREIMGLPPLEPDEDDPGGPADKQRARILAEDEELDEISRALADLTDDEFEKYWTRGEGLGRWATHAHPWTTLRNLLRRIRLKHGRGPRDPEGLASTYFKVVFGIWPGERKGDNPVGPG